MAKDAEFLFSFPPEPDEGSVPLSEAEAEQYLLKALADQKENPRQALWDLAAFYGQLRQNTKVLKCLQRLLELASDSEEKAAVYLAFGQSAEQCQDYVSAVDFYEGGLALEPTDGNVGYLLRNNLGYSHNFLNDFEAGEKYCREALALNPKRLNAYKNLGIALQGQGKYSEAAALFVQATQCDARDTRSLAMLEKLVREQPNLEPEFASQIKACREAVLFVQKTITQLTPPDSHHLNAATGWFGLGNYLEANDELEKIQPNLRAHPSVLSLRVEIYWTAKKWNEVETISKALVDMQPNDPSHWIALAYSTRRKSNGSIVEAKTILEKAADLFPFEETIHYNLSCYFSQLGKLVESKNHLDRALMVGNKMVLRELLLNDPDLEPLRKHYKLA